MRIPLCLRDRLGCKYSQCWCFAVVVLIILETLHVCECITITTVYAGKKKFKSYDLGFSFLPTLVKVKPNRLNLSFRRSQYRRPPKFKIEGSLPLKVPTILVERPDPNKYAYEPEEVININKDIRLGQDEKKDNGYYAAASDNHHQVNAPATRPDDSMAAQEAQQSMPLPSDHLQHMQHQQMPPDESMGAHESEPMPMPYPPPMMPMDGAMQAMPEQSIRPDESMVGQAPMPFAVPPASFMPIHMQSPPFPVMSMPAQEIPTSLAYPATVQGEQQFNPTDFQSPSQTRRSRTKRSLNLNEPYHHHINKVPNTPSSNLPTAAKLQMKPFGWSPPNPYGIPIRSSAVFLRPPNAVYHYPMYRPAISYPYQSVPMAKQDDSIDEPMVRSESIEMTSQMSSSPVTTQVQMPSVQGEREQRSLVPMKINIGEHYNPNTVYMDESIVPNMEDSSMLESAPTAVSNGIEEPVGMESAPYTEQYPSDYGKDSGPDDLRISFSLSGVHGGKMLPLGTGNNIEQFYKQLKHFEGNNMPVGLPPDQLYKYYRAHTFTNGIRVYRMTPAKVVRAKLLQALFG